MRLPPHLAVLSALLSFGALAQQGPAPTVIGSRVVGESGYEVSATVESVDLAARQVLLRREDGSFLTVKAGPRARNLAQVKPGDLVRATVTETLRLTLTRGAEPASGMTEDVARTPEGERPGIVRVETAHIVGDVVAVDQAARTAGIRTPDGVVRTVPVPDDVDITRIHPGDDVTLTVTRRSAIAVGPSAAAR